MSSNLILEGERFISEVIKAQQEGRFGDDEFQYGHAAGGLAQILQQNARDGLSGEVQKELLRLEARNLITKYGWGIVRVLRDELKLSLSIEELQESARSIVPNQTIYEK